MNCIDYKVFSARLEDELIRAGFNSIGRLRSLDSLKKDHSGRISIGMECLDRDLWDYRPALSNLAKLGVNKARLQSGWKKTEKCKGTYDFTWLDEVVDALLAIDIVPWLSLSYGNPLYADPGTEVGIGGLGHAPLNSPEAKSAWINYVETVVARYRGKITNYEVWNEPECPVFFPYGEQWAEKYIELVSITSKVIRETDPSARVTACTASNIGVQSGAAAKLLQAGIGKYIDALAYHGYRSLPEQMNYNSRRAYRQIVKKFAPDIEIWQGESGIPSYNAPTSFGALSNMTVSEEIQAKWLSRRVIGDLADPRLSLISYFHLYDFKHFTLQHDYYYGILRKEDYSRKPAFEVLQLLCFLCDQQTVPDEALCLEFRPAKNGTGTLSAADALNCQQACFKRRNQPFFAYWYPEVLDAAFVPRRIDIGYWLGERGTLSNPVIIDSITRKVYSVSTGENNWINHAPVTSYPLILTEYEAIKEFTEMENEPVFQKHPVKNSFQINGG